MAVAKRALVLSGKNVLSWEVVEAAARVMMVASFPEDAGSQSWMNILTMSGAGSVYRDELETSEEDDSRLHELLKLLISTSRSQRQDIRPPWTPPRINHAEATFSEL